ncbi:C40 family peptidase [Streptomyces purpureus]|uniref:C40 family peptidase n=1 Tax=Streptomyces purpureus TaxID=1951 RepID=UPI0003746987|nr:C40 family peptidase [Streptomyces purpureus]
MSGRLLRAVCTAALVSATTVTTVLGAPAAALPVEPTPPPVAEETEEEVPEDDEPEEVPEDDAAALGPEDPGDDSVGALLVRLRSLYQQAEAATETYNATASELARQTAATKALNLKLARTRGALSRSRDDVGRLARAQYQGAGEFSSYVRFLLSPDLGVALDRRRLIDRAARERAAAVARLEDGERRAHSLAVAARRALDRQQTLAARQKEERDAVHERLREVEELLAALSPDQLAALDAREQTVTAGAQSALMDSGVLDVTRTPTEAGAQALRYAVGQIGKPYVWGAEGPEAFDCSGLTSQAWADAGLAVPRTSQEQWRTLPRVELSDLRPGDLVVYFPGATHVALYLGEGLVVHAPRPGGLVKVSPIAANPLLGAVRPDPAGTPLPSFTPPPLPEGATDGADEGFAQDSPEPAASAR